MRNLKYIKLYEAFESVKLSKVLRFIDISDRKNFVKIISSICHVSDFPVSKINDSFFEYLAFKKAINLLPDNKKTECKAESKTIPGEFCKGGRINRTWGKGIRNVVCDECNGTGFSTSTKKFLKYIKFWFSREGKLICTTGCDGIKRPQLSKIKNYSGNESEYDQTPLTNDQLLSVPILSKIKIKINYSTRPTICTAWKDRNGILYAIQDDHNGTKPPGNDWAAYGKYSWCITNDRDYTRGSAFLLSEKTKKEEEKENPYDYNNILDINRLSISNRYNVEELLSKSHFALVMDYEMFKKSEFQKSSDIRKDRTISKKDALSLKNEHEIRSANLNRYLTELSNRFNIGDSLVGISKVIPRLFGWNNFLFFIIRESNMSEFDTILSEMHSFMETNDIDDKSRKEFSIRRVINKSYQRTSDLSRIINENIAKSNKSLKDDLKNPENKEEKLKRIEIFNLVIKISSDMANNIFGKEIECFADLEIAYSKILAMRNLWTSKGHYRLNSMRYVTGPFNNIQYEGTSIYQYLINLNSSECDLCIKDLKDFNLIINKL